MTTLTQYITDHRTAHTKRGTLTVPGAAEIKKKWQERIVTRQLHTQGEDGARQYLADYGRGIGAPKCLALALQAEVAGYPALARGFWKRAAELEGVTFEAEDEAQAQVDAPVASTAPTPAAPAPTEPSAPPTDSVFPAHLQPGQLSTMQPTDAQHPREWYIAHEMFYGQPKRDGQRLVVGIERLSEWYQTRSLRLLQSAPSPSISHGLQKAFRKFGPFILDGEVFYLDVAGGEHRTGAQAAEQNKALGQPAAPVKPRFAIFKALYANGEDLTPRTERELIAAGETIGQWLTRNGYNKSFEVLPTARTQVEKAALCLKQQTEGREGEVWVRCDCPYVGGKYSAQGAPLVRTKYLTEFPAVVLSLTPTTAAGRPFGAVEIAVNVQGVLTAIGSIGTGFDAEQMAELAQRFAAGAPVVIEVASQGFTEKGQVWHGRFLDFSTVAPTDCADPRA
jgi:bifunctional non-homologous end joining protein LigD